MSRRTIRGRLHFQFLSRFGILFGRNIVRVFSKKFEIIFDSNISLYRGTIFDPNKIPNCETNWMCRRRFIVPLVKQYLAQICTKIGWRWFSFCSSLASRIILIFYSHFLIGCCVVVFPFFFVIFLSIIRMSTKWFFGSLIFSETFFIFPIF